MLAKVRRGKFPVSDGQVDRPELLLLLVLLVLTLGLGVAAAENFEFSLKR